jgi:hypothetical protein
LILKIVRDGHFRSFFANIDAERLMPGRFGRRTID